MLHEQPHSSNREMRLAVFMQARFPSSASIAVADNSLAFADTPKRAIECGDGFRSFTGIDVAVESLRSPLFKRELLGLENYVRCSATGLVAEDSAVDSCPSVHPHCRIWVHPAKKHG